MGRRKSDERRVAIMYEDRERMEDEAKTRTGLR